MATITYTDKVATNTNPGVADINKVKAEDMNEIKTVVNGNYTEFLNSNSILIAGITSNFTTSTTSDTLLPLDTTIASTGSLLTLNTTSHYITIGSGVSYVKVSAMVRWTNSLTANQRFNIALQKNSDIVAINTIRSSAGTNQSQSIPPMLIPVSPGDKIYMYVRSFDSSGNTIGGVATTTFLQVETVA